MPEESLMAAWREAEAAAGGPEVAPVSAEPEAPAAAVEAPAAADKAAPSKPTAVAPTDKADAVAETGDGAELAQLQALAAKLNFKLDGNRVSVAERVALRAEKREAQARIDQLEQELGGKVAAARKELDPMFAARKAWEEKDLDGFARSLGVKDWNGLQQDALNHFSDPNYKVIQQLKQEREQERAERERETQAARETAANRQRMEAVTEYKRGLSQEMAGSEHKLLKAMSADPMFVDVIHAIQEQHYDRASNSTVTPEEALELGMRGNKTAFKAELRSLYDRLKAAFEDGSPAAIAAAVAPKKTGKTGAVKREAEAPHVAKSSGNGYMDPKDREYWAQQLKSSQD